MPAKITYIEKVTMSLYRLCEFDVATGTVAILAQDLPEIIYGKYLRTVKNQGFSYGK